jgi:hypothetical protein
MRVVPEGIQPITAGEPVALLRFRPKQFVAIFQWRQVRTRPSSDDAHEVAFYRRHSDDDPRQAVPGREFLNTCPAKVRATMRAVLAQVAAAPPKRFAGGGYWEAM